HVGQPFGGRHPEPARREEAQWPTVQQRDRGTVHFPREEPVAKPQIRRDTAQELGYRRERSLVQALHPEVLRVGGHSGTFEQTTQRYGGPFGRTYRAVLPLHPRGPG